MGLIYDSIICCICGKEITGRYFTNVAGENACEAHAEHSCFCCGRFCEPAKSMYVERYGYICPHCVARLVTRESAVRMAGVINDFYRRNKFRIPAYQLHLVSSDKINDICGKSGLTPTGLATYDYTYTDEHMGGRTYIVYVLAPLPRTLAASVIAHEVLHLWQFEHHIEAPDEISEGLCNLGSYLFLQYINRTESNIQSEYLVRSSDPVYGQGFRNMKAIYDKGGWEAIIALLKKYKK